MSLEDAASSARRGKSSRAMVYARRLPACVKKFLGHHLLAAISLLTFISVGLAVPQIRELILDVFAAGGVIRWMTFLLAVEGALLIGYFIFQSPKQTFLDRLASRFPSRFGQWIQYPLRAFVVAPTQVLYLGAFGGRR
ncbi:MAG: hypothetical protein AAF664_19895, partial [Planctomycetota bacterium]